MMADVNNPELEKQVALNKQRIFDHGRRIDTLEKVHEQNQKMMLMISKVETGVEHLSKQVDALSNRVSDYEKKPGDKWEKFKWGVLMILVSAALALVLAHVGLRPGA